MASTTLKASWTIGLVLFIHAAYSAYEFVSASKRSTSHTLLQPDITGVAGANTVAALPTDIIIELLLGLAIHIVCSVSSVRGGLRSVRWREWARMQSSWEEDDDFDSRDRPGFTDIVARRKAYAARRDAKIKAAAAGGKKATTPSIVVTSSD